MAVGCPAAPAPLASGSSALAPAAMYAGPNEMQHLELMRTSSVASTSGGLGEDRVHGLSQPRPPLGDHESPTERQ